MITIEKITDKSGFSALKEEWNELLQSSSSDCLFLTWEWLYTWWSHLSRDRKLHIIRIKSGDTLIAIAPLALRPRRFLRLLPFRVLEFLGTGHVGSDYLNLLIRDGYEEDALRAISGSLTERKLILELSQVERTSRHIIDLALQLRLLGWSAARTTIDFCPYVRLAGHTWESYLDSLGKSHRANFRRRLRKLDKEFDVRFEQAGTEEQRRKALNILVSLHHKRWQDRGGSDALHRQQLVEFHEQFSRTALERGWLRLYVLYLNERPAASLYGFVYNGRFYFYQSGFDPGYGKYSVGLVLMGLAIKSAAEEGVEEYDMLHGHEEYKYLWARDERELVRLELFPPHIGGSLSRQTMHIRGLIKRTIRYRFSEGLHEWSRPGKRPELYGDSLKTGGRYATRTD